MIADNSRFISQNHKIDIARIKCAKFSALSESLVTFLILMNMPCNQADISQRVNIIPVINSSFLIITICMAYIERVGIFFFIYFIFKRFLYHCLQKERKKYTKKMRNRRLNKKKTTIPTRKKSIVGFCNTKYKWTPIAACRPLTTSVEIITHTHKHTHLQCLSKDYYWDFC